VIFEAKKVTTEREIQKSPKIAKIESAFNIFSQSVSESFKLVSSFLLVKVGRISYICTRKAERTLFLIADRVVCQARQAALFYNQLFINFQSTFYQPK
jgi:hypothetical protein